MMEDDIIWLEVNANFNLKIYFINPGEEIFAALNVWPVNPIVHSLSMLNEFTQIRLTKKSNVLKNDKCEADPTYVYGGKYIVHTIYINCNIT